MQKAAQPGSWGGKNGEGGRSERGSSRITATAWHPIVPVHSAGDDQATPPLYIRVEVRPEVWIEETLPVVFTCSTWPSGLACSPGPYHVVKISVNQTNDFGLVRYANIRWPPTRRPPDPASSRPPGPHHFTSSSWISRHETLHLAYGHLRNLPSPRTWPSVFTATSRLLVLVMSCMASITSGITSLTYGRKLA